MRDSYLPTGSCGGFDGVNSTASPPVHLSYPSSATVTCNTHGSWKDQHCRRQNAPMPGCLFQPCFKIHDSSFRSVMTVGASESVHRRRSCLTTQTGTMAFFSPWRVPQIQFSTAGWTFLFDNRERVSERVVEQIVDLRVPQTCECRPCPPSCTALPRVWLVLVLRNWKETEACKNDVYLLPTELV